jgi:hypothetical protein
MFESAEKAKGPSGGALAMGFLGQTLLASIGVLIGSYPVFRAVEMKLLEHGTEQSPALWAWRWAAIAIPVILGFTVGYRVQLARPGAFVTGRFVWTIPSLRFPHDFVGAVSSFSISGAIDEILREGGGLEMFVGSVCYSLGVIKAHSKANAA